MVKQAATFQSKKAEKFFDELADNSKDVGNRKKNYMKALSIPVFNDVMDHFAKEMGTKSPWGNWTRMYAKHMEKRGRGGNKILQDNGRLRQSFLMKNHRKISNGILWFNPAKTSKGFPYAAHHDAGKSTSNGKPRPFMWLSNKAMDGIGKITLGFMLKGK